MEARFNYNNNLIKITNFTHYKEDDDDGNPYNCSFTITVISDGFQGIAEWECDYREWLKFIKNLDSLYNFKAKEVTFNDISYGSKISFAIESNGHLKISGILFGENAEQSLNFMFTADQTSLNGFIDELKMC